MVLSGRIGQEGHDVRHAIILFPVFRRCREIRAGTDFAEARFGNGCPQDRRKFEDQISCS